jgi:hypothetical protein
MEIVADNKEKNEIMMILFLVKRFERGGDLHQPQESVFWSKLCIL